MLLNNIVATKTGNITTLFDSDINILSQQLSATNIIQNQIDTVLSVDLEAYKSHPNTYNRLISERDEQANQLRVQYDRATKEKEKAESVLAKIEQTKIDLQSNPKIVRAYSEHPFFTISMFKNALESYVKENWQEYRKLIETAYRDSDVRIRLNIASNQTIIEVKADGQFLDKLKHKEIMFAFQTELSKRNSGYYETQTNTFLFTKEDYQDYKQAVPKKIIDIAETNKGKFDKIQVLDVIRHEEVEVIKIEDPLLVGTFDEYPNLFFLLGAWLEPITFKQLL